MPNNLIILKISFVLLYSYSLQLYAQSFTFNPLAIQDSWGIISVIEMSDYYLCSSSDYNISGDSVYCSLIRLSKSGQWIDEKIYSYSRYSRSEFITNINGKYHLTMLALEEDRIINKFIENEIETNQVFKIDINQNIDITYNDILQFRDSLYLFAIHDTRNLLPRIALIERINSKIKFSIRLNAAPLDIKFNFDSSQIIIKGGYIIDLMNFRLDTLIKTVNNSKLGTYVGDIIGIPFKYVYINTGGQPLDENVIDHKDTIDIGISILDSNFVVLNNTVYGKKGDTVDIPARTQSIAGTKDGFYFGGTSNFSVWTYPYGYSPSWFLIVKTDSSLNLKWQKYYGGDAYYFMTGIIGTSDGGCLAYGTKQDTVAGNFNRDIFIIKLDKEGQLTYVKTFPKLKELISIYPNPAKDNITVNMEKIDLKAIIIFYNLEGKEMERIKLTNIKNSYSIKTWPKGIYFYKVNFNGSANNYGGKLVVE